MVIAGFMNTIDLGFSIVVDSLICTQFNAGKFLKNPLYYEVQYGALYYDIFYDKWTS